jgi:hypothetical protein
MCGALRALPGSAEHDALRQDLRPQRSAKFRSEPVIARGASADVPGFHAKPDTCADDPFLQWVNLGEAWIATAKTPRDDDEEARSAVFLIQRAGCQVNFQQASTLKPDEPPKKRRPEPPFSLEP